MSAYTPVPTAERSPRAKHRAAAGDSGPLLEEEDAGPGPSSLFLVSLNSFAFAYSLVVATLGVVILPSESIRLFHERHAMMLGMMLGCTGVTQLLGPAVGYHSDRSTSSYGRRRPLLVVGAIIACCGCIAMRAAREFYWRYAYLGALTASIGCLLYTSPSPRDS